MRNIEIDLTPTVTFRGKDFFIEREFDLIGCLDIKREVVLDYIEYWKRKPTVDEIVHRIVEYSLIPTFLAESIGDEFPDADYDEYGDLIEAEMEWLEGEIKNKFEKYFVNPLTGSV